MALMMAAGCSQRATGTSIPVRSSPAVVTATVRVPMPSPSPLPPVNPVTPALQAIATVTVTPDQAIAAHAIPGVIAVARITLGLVTAHAPGGLRQLSVAGVDPLEFRPLAPAPTADAAFVWQDLLAGRLYLAHEEQPVLGVPLGDPLTLDGPQTSITPRLGGLAANGIPNIASGLISQKLATSLGLPGPTELLVGIAPGAPLDAIQAALAKILPQAQVMPIVALVNHPLASGTAAEKLLGTFTYKANPDGSITQNGDWVRNNIVTRNVPIIGQVTCNKLMFPQLIGALTDLQDEGLSGLINVTEYHQHEGNCYQPRFVDSDPTRGISNHAWGIAIDINRVENPEGSPSRQDPRLVQAFAHWGFRWGGIFYPTDAMHFELAGIMQ